MVRLFVILTLLCVIAGMTRSEAARGNDGPGERWEDVEFQPGRLIYYTIGGGGSRGIVQPWWAIDYPEAEQHFLPALNRLTKMSVSEDSRHLDAVNPEIFDHPFLFLQQPGRGNWSPTEKESKSLREYFDRGGFMLVDDFHGEYEWQSFAESAQTVFPDREIVEIPAEDSLMRVFYSLEDRLQIPGRRHVTRDGRVSMDGPPHWRGIYDRRGRIEVGINFNMDMGDAWEHADDPSYPADMTGQAYRLGANYVIYALTH